MVEYIVRVGLGGRVQLPDDILKMFGLNDDSVVHIRNDGFNKLELIIR